MEWWLVLVIIFGGLMLLLLTGLPVAFSFALVNIIGVYLMWGGVGGLQQLISSMFSSLANFTLLPLPLFILMGDVMFHSGIGTDMINALDKWIGRLPARLSFVTLGTATLLATICGNSMASVAVMGSTLLPEMEKRGYKYPMSLGPILGSAGLAVMIPPSGLAIILGWLGGISIGKLLMAIIVPGLLLAAIYFAYMLGRMWLQPDLAPAYAESPVPLSQKLVATVRYILPVGLVIFLVVGVIFMGMATPSEAAATGALGTFLLAAIYGKFSWNMVRKSITSTVSVTSMLFLIMAGGTAFSQILAYSGASRTLAEIGATLPIAPIAVIIVMQLVLLFLGGPLDAVPIMMITVPIFVPVVKALGFDLVWFGTIYLLNMMMASISPPIGSAMFVLKSIAPHISMGDIYRATLPFLACDLVGIALIMAFPQIALWLPAAMR